MTIRMTTLSTTKFDKMTQLNYSQHHDIWLNDIQLTFSFITVSILTMVKHDNYVQFTKVTMKTMFIENAKLEWLGLES